MAKKETAESAFDFGIDTDDIRPELAGIPSTVTKGMIPERHVKGKLNDIYAHDLEGKLRIIKIDCVTEMNGGPGSTMELVKFPAGRLRLLGDMSLVQYRSETPFSIGWGGRHPLNGTPKPANVKGLSTLYEPGEGLVRLGENLPARTRVFTSRLGFGIMAHFPEGVMAKTLITGYVIYVQT